MGIFTTVMKKGAKAAEKAAGAAREAKPILRTLEDAAPLAEEVPPIGSTALPTDELLAPPKKLTKAEREKRDQLATFGRVAEERGFVPGENMQPFINPSAEELAAIRAERGGYTGVRRPGDLKESAGGVPGYVDPDVGDIFPPALARDRPQAPLPRRESATGATSERVKAMLDNPEVERQIMEAAKAGEGVRDWYNTMPLRAAFHREFGPEEGQRRFEDFIGMVAGTSTGSDIGRNIKTASNYFSQKYGGGRDVAAQPYLRKDAAGNVTKTPEGEKVYASPYYEVPPEGYGSDKQQTHMLNVNTYSREGAYDPLNNPKIEAFRENLLGNWTPTTIDKHAVRLSAMATRDPRFLTPQGAAAYKQMMDAGLEQGAAMDQLLTRATNWTDVPDKNMFEYPQFEQMWTKIAAKMGISPAELQAQAWVGGGAKTGLGSPDVTFMDAFKDRIRRTAIRDNIPPEQVLKLMLHGKLTLAELEPAQMPEGGSMIG